MMALRLRNRVAIIGYGAIPLGDYPDQSQDELATMAIKHALQDAGISKSDLDGIVTTPNLLNTLGLHLLSLQQQLELPLKTGAEICCGGIAGGLAIKHAILEIISGGASMVLCYGASKRSQELQRIGMGWGEQPGTGPSWLDPVIQPYGIGVIWAYACSARRYMHEYSATETDFALAAVRDREAARHNPYAAFRDPISIEDVLNSRPICTPLKLLDCCAPKDGAAALVLCSGELAKKYTDSPIYISALGEYHDDSCLIPFHPSKSITQFISVNQAAKQAYAAAKISPSELDLAEIYAPFSSHELMIPEDLGFFPKGGMIQAIRDGQTCPGGLIPINTDGGLLSRGHPAMVTPFYQMIALVKQFRQQAGRMQLDQLERALMHCEAGMLNSSMVFILES